MKRLALGLLLSVVLLGLVWGLTDISGQTAAEGVAEAFGNLSLGGLAIAGACYVLSYVGRALRLALLLPGKDRLLHLTSISARHSLFNLVLPLRSGEATLPLMLKRETGRSLAEGAAALVVARVMDLLSVALFLGAGLAYAGLGEGGVGAGDGATAGTGSAAGAAGGQLAGTGGAAAGGAEALSQAEVALRTGWLVAGLLAALLLMRPVARWIGTRWAPKGGRAAAGGAGGATSAGIATSAGNAMSAGTATTTGTATPASTATSPDASAAPTTHRLGLVEKLTTFAGRTALHLARQPLSKLAGALGCSLLTWLLTYGACFALIADMAADTGTIGPALAPVTFLASLIASTFLHLTGILPINALAGVGVWEAGWVAGYMFIGVTETAAIASAVVSHAVIFVMIAVLGGVGMVMARRGRGAGG